MAARFEDVTEDGESKVFLTQVLIGQIIILPSDTHFASFFSRKGRAPLPPTIREVEQNKQNEAKDAIRKSRNRGAALIEQGLACEESAVAGAGSSSSVNTSRNNPMAASLYKLGIGQLSDALAICGFKQS